MAVLEGLREADLLPLLHQGGGVLQHPGGSVVPWDHPVHSQLLKIGYQVLSAVPQGATVEGGAAPLQQQQRIKSL